MKKWSVRWMPMQGWCACGPVVLGTYWYRRLPNWNAAVQYALNQYGFEKGT